MEFQQLGVGYFSVPWVVFLFFSPQVAGDFRAQQLEISDSEACEGHCLWLFGLKTSFFVGMVFFFGKNPGTNPRKKEHL